MNDDFDAVLNRLGKLKKNVKKIAQNNDQREEPRRRSSPSERAMQRRTEERSQWRREAYRGRKRSRRSRSRSRSFDTDDSGGSSDDNGHTAMRRKSWKRPENGGKESNIEQRRESGTKTKRVDREEKRPIPQMNMSFNVSDGSYSLSVEETNRLRLSLGLKPLQTAEGHEQAHNEAQQVEIGKEQHEEEDEAMEAHKRIKMARMRRKERMLKQVKSLGESSSSSEDEDDDKEANGGAAAWINKSRRLQREKQIAEQMARQLGLEGGEGEGSDRGEEQKRKKEEEYSTRDLRGIKVAHSKDTFAPGKDVILTLRDTNILDHGSDDDSDAATAADELENIEMQEQEKRDWNKKRSKKTNQLDEALDGLENHTSNILSKYDDYDTEEMQRESFVLDGLTREERVERVRERLKKKKNKQLQQQQADNVTTAQQEKSLVYNLSEKEATLTNDVDVTNAIVASDFMSREEAAQAGQVPKIKKRKTKKSKKTKRKLQEDADVNNQKSTAQLLLEGMGDRTMDEQSDFGSRQSSVKLQREELEKSRSEMDKKQAYETALGKAKEKAERLLQRPPMFDDNDDDDATAAVIERTRILEQHRQNMKSGAEKVAERIRTSSTQEDGRVQGSTIVFDPTAEFVRNLDSAERMVNQPDVKPVENDSMMDVDEEQKESPVSIKPRRVVRKNLRPKDTVEEIEEREERDTAARVDRSMSDTKAVALQKEETTEGVSLMEDEPVIGSSLSAALNFARQKKFISESERASQARSRKEARRGDVLNLSDEKETFTLDKYDDFGQVLSTRDAYKKMSQAFHGKMPGFNKREKERKKMLSRMRSTKMSSTDTPLGSAAALKKLQRATDSALIVLDSRKQTQLADMTTQAAQVAKPAEPKKRSRKKK